MRNLMTTFKMLLLLMATVVIVSSCGDKEDVYDSDDYFYYLDIKSEVRLYLNDAADEDESGMVNPMVDHLSRTIYHMQKAIRENENQKGNRNKVATLVTTCDSLYRDYAEVYPEQKGNVICCVKLLRCPLNPNGTAKLKDAITLKYYYFWREESGMIIPNLGLPYVIRPVYTKLEDIQPNKKGTMKTIYYLFGTLAILLMAAACGNEDEPNSPQHRLMIPKKIPVYSLDLPASVEAVDLGLSVKWASCNLGASVPNDYGGYFGWGDPTGKLWSDQGIGFNKNGYTWNSNNYGGMNPTKEIGGTDQDVVTVHWGEGWRTPSVAEARELANSCHWQMHEENGSKWFVVTGPNGNSIIMPMCGIYGDDEMGEDGRFHEGPLHMNTAGFYWTSSICNLTNDFASRGYPINADVIQAWAFRFVQEVPEFQSLQGMFVNHLRAFHMSIRPVHDK